MEGRAAYTHVTAVDIPGNSDPQMLVQVKYTQMKFTNS